MRYRFIVFISMTCLFSLLFGGLFSTTLSILVTISFLGFIQIFRFEQLPQERLSKFHEVFNSCISKDQKGRPLNRIVMHRGGATETPENTIEAVQQVSFILRIEDVGRILSITMIGGLPCAVLSIDILPGI